jgi:transposase InsO family protein
VKFAFIDAEKARWPVELQCELFGVSRSGFYAWKGRPEARRTQEDAELVVEIKAASKVGRGNYGSPRVHRELRANGRRISRKRVERLMRQEGIVARRKRRFRKTTDSNHKHPIAPNVLARNFEVELPDRAWVTDVTYVWTHEGWLHLAVILDLFSRQVVAWAASANNDRALAVGALDRATCSRAPAQGLIHHSDRGSVYASSDYGDALTAIGAVKSMSRKGDCWDNAVAESFFATIKGEMIDHEDYPTRAAAIGAIGDYIDRFYNPCRRHSAIDYVSPIESELKFMNEKTNPKSCID